jgi:hypothetical protein
MPTTQSTTLAMARAWSSELQAFRRTSRTLPFRVLNSALSANALTGVGFPASSCRTSPLAAEPWPLKCTIFGSYWFRYCSRSSGRAAQADSNSMVSRNSAARIFSMIERHSSARFS